MGFKFPRASDTVAVLGQNPNAGTLRSYSRGDHQHAINAIRGTQSVWVNQALYPFYGTLGLGRLANRWLEAYVVNAYLDTVFSQFIQPPVETDIYLSTQSASTRSLFLRSYDTAQRIVAQAINGRLDIPRGGDIALLDNQFLGVGRRTSLPTPSAAYRGKMVYLDAAYTVSQEDELYICVYNFIDEAYYWRRISLAP